MAKFFRVKDADGNLISMESSESTNNKVDSISSESTENQYPSAKAVYELINGHDYSQDFFTLVALSDGTFKFSGENENTIQYSTDNGETWSESAQLVEINVNSGDKVLWKGEIISQLDEPENDDITIGTFYGSTATYNAQGNIMSLAFGDNFQGVTTIETKLLFKLLFDRSKIVHANNLVLPATTLSLGCYSSMFKSCRQLVSAPQLPAITLAQSCYHAMFFGCTSLTEAPQLLAETLEVNCYNNMFSTCPSLSYIKMIANDISANGCLNSWVSGVAANGTFIKSANMNDLPSGEDGIPEGWQVYTEEEYELVRQYQLNSKENKSNKVVSLSSSSTDEQYPSAKCVYDLIGNIENLLGEL